MLGSISLRRGDKRRASNKNHVFTGGILWCSEMVDTSTPLAFSRWMAGGASERSGEHWASYDGARFRMFGMFDSVLLYGR